MQKFSSWTVSFNFRIFLKIFRIGNVRLLEGNNMKIFLFFFPSRCIYFARRLSTVKWFIISYSFDAEVFHKCRLLIPFIRQNQRDSVCFEYLTIEGTALDFCCSRKQHFLALNPVCAFSLFSLLLNSTQLSLPGIPVIVLSKWRSLAWCDCLLWSLVLMEVYCHILLLPCGQIQFQLEGAVQSFAHHLLLSSLIEFNLLMSWLPKAYHLILKSLLLSECLEVFSALFRFVHYSFKLLLWALLKQISERKCQCAQTGNWKQHSIGTNTVFLQISSAFV